MSQFSQEKRAVVLLSGGLDSTTVLAMAAHQGRRCYCLTVCYGQRHSAELEAARQVASQLGAREHVVLDVDLGGFGGSALTDAAMEVPKGGDVTAPSIPLTYVPARNTVLLSLALAWAETLSAAEIWIGVSAVDYSGYPDCRPEFIRAFEAMAQVATKAAVEQGDKIAVVAPLLELSKAETIRRGLALGVDYGKTHTCYDPSPGGIACGCCDACQLRLRAFAEVGTSDPVRYS